MSKKSSAAKSFVTFFSAIIAVMAFRWLLFEPFVIPSGSMIPTLFIHDHIIVSKYSFGIRWPFTKSWMTSIELPARGDVVVFRSVEDGGMYMIKRVVGLPGDKISFDEEGMLLINGESTGQVMSPKDIGWNEVDLGDSPEDYEFKREQLGGLEHWVMYDRSIFRFAQAEYEVPNDMLFMMGDNRDRSRDSRYWGALPIQNLIGKAQYVWLSCNKTLPKVNILCDPRFIRWHRFFHKI